MKRDRRFMIGVFGSLLLLIVFLISRTTFQEASQFLRQQKSIDYTWKEQEFCIDLSENRNRIIIFFKPGCAGCLYQINQLNQLITEYKGIDWYLFSLSAGFTDDIYQRIWPELKRSEEVHPGNVRMGIYRFPVVPASFIFCKGRLKAEYYGETDIRELYQNIQKFASTQN